MCGSPSLRKPWEKAPSSRWRLQFTETTQQPQRSARPEASWPLPCASRYGGPGGARAAQGEGVPAGTLPTPGVPGPRLQKEDVRPATSRPVLTGWSFYFYIHTSRFFSCPQEKLTEKGGLGSLPGAGGSQAVSLSWRCSLDRAIPRGTLPCRAAWGHPSWPGPCRLGDSRMLQELALCPEAGHSRGSGAAAAHLSGVSGLRPPLTPRLILPAPSGHAPDLRADAGRTGEEGTRGQDRLDRTPLTFLTKNNKLHAGSPNLARDPQRGPGKAAPSPGPRVLTCEVGPTTAGLTSDPRPWQEGCMSPCGASTQTPVLGNSGRKEPDQRGEAPPGPTRSVTLC